ncbi:MAG: S8 family serine peptidase, partial [Lachnospiraceae bacterium]|nr:S8 family serine peptidase [Lachnospiraceae bacterium]
VTVLPVRVLNDNGRGSSYGVAAGIYYAADQGAKVINLSLGGGHDESKHDAIEYAVEKGATVCIAAGNESADTGLLESCPSEMTTPGVVVVAALDPDETQSFFSNYGKSVDIAAPGNYILSTYISKGAWLNVAGAEGYYEFEAGTSMATPHVTAGAAMLQMLFPKAKPATIEKYLKKCAKDLGSSGRDDLYGYGGLKLSKAKKLPLSDLSITKQPAAVSIFEGKTASFTVAASGSGLKYRWQCSSDGGKTWRDVSTSNTGYNKETLKISVKASLNNYQYRCVVKDSAGKSATSKGALLTVARITNQPKNVSADVGTQAVFQVKTVGPQLKFRWQCSPDGGKTWNNVSSANAGYNKAKMTTDVKAGRDGYLYRCLLTDSAGNKLYSNKAKLTINFSIDTQPKNVNEVVGKTASFTVKASGAGLKYRWQCSPDGGKTWNNVTSKNEGYNKATLQIVVKASLNKYRYRCVVTNSAGAKLTSKAVTLTVTPEIVTQPTAKGRYVGMDAVFKIKATGYSLKYRWQCSSDGGKTWRDVSSANAGYNTRALTVTAKSSLNKYQYRCKVTDGNGKVIYSKGARLDVPIPKILWNPIPYVELDWEESVWLEIKAEGYKVEYRWQVSKDGGESWTNVADRNQGYNTNKMLLHERYASDGDLYRCRVTDLDGRHNYSEPTEVEIFYGDDEW